MALSMLSLVFYFISLENGSLGVIDVALQLAVFAVYCVAVVYQDAHFKQHEKTEEDQVLLQVS
jgi:hypothetical protein